VGPRAVLDAVLLLLNECLLLLLLISLSNQYGKFWVHTRIRNGRYTEEIL